MKFGDLYCDDLDCQIYVDGSVSLTESHVMDVLRKQRGRESLFGLRTRKLCSANREAVRRREKLELPPIVYRACGAKRITMVVPRRISMVGRQPSTVALKRRDIEVAMLREHS